MVIPYIYQCLVHFIVAGEWRQWLNHVCIAVASINNLVRLHRLNRVCFVVVGEKIKQNFDVFNWSIPDNMLSKFYEIKHASEFPFIVVRIGLNRPFVLLQCSVYLKLKLVFQYCRLGCSEACPFVQWDSWRTFVQLYLKLIWFEDMPNHSPICHRSIY